MMKRLLTASLVACALLATPSFATITSEEGVSYAQQRNQYGVVLRAGTDVIYLGTSCDVLSAERGEGKWATTPDQVILDFFNKSLSLSPVTAFVGRDIPECAL